MTETDKFIKVTDGRGRAIRGLWERNGRFYAQVRYPGRKSASKVPLKDKDGVPVQTAAEAVKAQARLLDDREDGKEPTPAITPCFCTYIDHYQTWCKTFSKKGPKTIKLERIELNFAAEFFGTLRLSQITAVKVMDCIAKRKEKVAAHTCNMLITALRHLFELAKRERYFRRELPTEGLKYLTFKREKRPLVPNEHIDRICAEAVRSAVNPLDAYILKVQEGYSLPDGKLDWEKAFHDHPDWEEACGVKGLTGWSKLDKPEAKNGRRSAMTALYQRAWFILRKKPEVAGKAWPVYKHGEQFADWVKIMAYTGARYAAALALQWEDIDWTNRVVNIHRATKYSKHIVVPFNPKLEAHLKDMHKRRLPLGSNGQFSRYLFPSPRSDGTKGHITNFRQTWDEVLKATKINEERAAEGKKPLTPHDLKHYFVSMCVMSKVDFMTVAEWAGHADGGILVGNTYGHLNPTHSAEQAKQVDFDNPGKKKPATVDLTKVDLTRLSAAELLATLAQAQAQTQQKPQGAAA